MVPLALGFDFMNRLIERWHELTSRERLMLMALAVVLVVALSYQIVWLPLSDAIDTEEHRRITLQQSMPRIENIIQHLSTRKIRQQSSINDASSLQPLVTLIDTSLKQTNLNMAWAELRASTEDMVKLEFQQVAFDDLIRWLANLQQEQAVVIVEIMLQQDEKNGMVMAKITLTRE
jgi:general secretion pathway protein M